MAVAGGECSGEVGRSRPHAIVPATALCIVAVTGMALAICAPSSAGAETPALFADRWWPGSEHRATRRVLPPVELSLASAHSEPAGPHPVVAMRTDPPSSRTRAADGLASFYGSGTRTASGERFNPRDLTAAHRTLPFGTRVRVTNLSSGRSVTVRVNDRGPFIPGRVIDVSQAAAEELGMVGRGVTKVKLDVVQ